MRLPALLLLPLVACGSAAPKPAPLGVAGHLAEAERCEAEASRHDARAEAASGANLPACAPPVIETMSGGQRIGIQNPCWTTTTPGDRDRDAAARLRADARMHRAAAGQLITAERVACEKVPDDDLMHTPFAHRDDVVSVTAELDGTTVRGASIRFRKVAGLSADWLRTVIGCHQARVAALGFDPTYMGYDPTLVAGAKVTVTDAVDGEIVVVRGDDDAAALAIYGRAQDLVGGAK